MKILIIEDDKATAEFVAKGLQDAGYQTGHAEDGVRGLEMAKSGTFDLAVVDIMLPGLDGFAVIRGIREAGVEMPLLVLSAKDSVESKISGLDCGGDDYLAKPFSFGELLARMQEEAEEKGMSEKELLAVYFAEDGSVTDPGQLAVEALYAKRYQPQAYARICGYLSAVWDDLERFPVGTVASDGNAGVSFADSWMQSRNFGGERGHEGCDIMASVNERGIYPIYSVSDGVVENVGWLRLGGYRIGIRSPSGAYFYYAHLAEYAKEFEVGETVLAGTHLGYMGDTGYSDIPGTTGNFPVHLHFGIYINDENGQELSVNPYPMVLYLWEQQGKYTFGETKRQ